MMATRQETAWLSRYRSRADFWTLISFAAIGLFVALLIYPLLRLAIPSLAPGDGDEQSFVSVYGSLFSDPYYRASLINSAILSICTTLLAGALGTTVAYLVARYDLRGKLFIRAAIVLTFVSPPFIGAYSWVLLLGNNGVITSALRTIGIHVPSIYGWTGLILVLTLQGFPFVFLLVSAGLKSVDQSVEDAAINLGTKPIRVVFKVILPLIIPSLSTGALLVFVTAFTDFSTPSIIGQNINVFPRVVYSEFVNEMAGNYRLASALSVVMLLVTVGALVFQRWFARRHAYGQETVRPLAVKRASKRFRACAEAFVYCAVGIACLPLLVVVISSFLKTNKSRIVWEFHAGRIRPRSPRLGIFDEHVVSHHDRDDPLRRDRQPNRLHRRASPRHVGRRNRSSVDDALRGFRGGSGDCLQFGIWGFTVLHGGYARDPHPRLSHPASSLLDPGDNGRAGATRTSDRGGRY